MFESLTGIYADDWATLHTFQQSLRYYYPQYACHVIYRDKQSDKTYSNDGMEYPAIKSAFLNFFQSAIEMFVNVSLCLFVFPLLSLNKCRTFQFYLKIVTIQRCGLQLYYY